LFNFFCDGFPISPRSYRNEEDTLNPEKGKGLHPRTGGLADKKTQQQICKSNTMSHFARLIPHCFRNLALQLGLDFLLDFLLGSKHLHFSESMIESGIKKTLLIMEKKDET
jgi:hypothetical protein